jgi:hypothetical protein
MRRWLNRALVVAAVAAAGSAGSFAVLSALDGGDGAPVAAASAAEAPVLAQTVTFGHDRVVTQVDATGRACLRVLKGSSTVARTCFRRLERGAIVAASSRVAVGGRAGTAVRAVIVHLTRKGTVWATLRRGAFYAAVPAGHRPMRLVVVLAGGRRTTTTLPSS